jgi:hypothetical protein
MTDVLPSDDAEGAVAVMRGNSALPAINPQSLIKQMLTSLYRLLTRRAMICW